MIDESAAGSHASGGKCQEAIRGCAAPLRITWREMHADISLGESTEVYQWGTFVHRDHRGRRLGLATKAANLRAVQSFRDDLELVTTQNAETNDYMVSINEKMGFRPVEVSAEFVKHL